MDIISWNARQIDVSLLLQKWTQTESVFMLTVALLTCQFIISFFAFLLSEQYWLLSKTEPKLADLQGFEIMIYE